MRLDQIANFIENHGFSFEYFKITVIIFIISSASKSSDSNSDCFIYSVLKRSFGQYLISKASL